MIRYAALAVIFLFSYLRIFSQPCSNNYILPVFPVSVERDVIYGTAPDYGGNPVTLTMNIFKPIGDNNPMRPCIVMMHAGGFFSGSKESLDSLCMKWAARGYVAATVGYRKGFWPPFSLIEPYAYDAAEINRAGYRCMQDMKGAIRFLKGRHLTDSTDINSFIAGGPSAGAIAGLHTAFLDKPSEKPADTYAIGNVTYLVITHPRPDLGDVDGTLNQNGYDASLKAVVSLLGALSDTSYIEDAAGPALFLYHQAIDPMVSCVYDQGLSGMPLGMGNNYPFMYGDCIIDTRALNAGYTSDRLFTYIYNGTDHDVHDLPYVDSLIAAFLGNLLCNTAGIEDHTSDVLQVTPNPSAGHFSITSVHPFIAGSELDVMDYSGKIVYSKTLNNTNRIEIDLPLANGIYLLRTSSANAALTTKVMITH